MVLTSFGALNFVHSFNLNNTIIFNICSFYHCFFCEQNVIFYHCIFFDSFNLIVQNNFVVIDLKYFMEILQKTITIDLMLSRVMASKDFFLYLMQKK